MSRFSIATNLIHSYIVTLARLLSDKEEATKIFNQLINNCYTELHKYVMMKDEIPATDAQITNYLFTIGELVMVRLTAVVCIVILNLILLELC